jgi:hypothetical protein
LVFRVRLLRCQVVRALASCGLSTLRRSGEFGRALGTAVAATFKKGSIASEQGRPAMTEDQQASFDASHRSDRAAPEHVRASPTLPAWITPELIAKTIGVWQPYYATRLTEDDAVAMLQGVGRLFKVL